MENAGIRVADFVLAILGRRPNKTIAVFCGKGNNAGDGLVVSRQLLCEGIAVDTFLLAPQYRLSSATRKNLEILKKLTKRIWRIKAKKDLEAINLSSYSLLVDAIFGIGVKGKVEGVFREAIQQMNFCKRTIISIDIPSGLDANQGRALGTAIKADYTLTLIGPKRGLLINQGPQFTGKLIVRHIGFPLK
jgi:hydroxyethylthiazole kinase-like uncharacterized protein yjeF